MKHVESCEICDSVFDGRRIELPFGQKERQLLDLLLRCEEVALGRVGEELQRVGRRALTLSTKPRSPALGPLGRSAGRAKHISCAWRTSSGVPTARSVIRRAKRSNFKPCKVPGCGKPSKGPRFRFLCEDHRDLPKAKLELLLKGGESKANGAKPKAAKKSKAKGGRKGKSSASPKSEASA